MKVDNVLRVFGRMGVLAEVLEVPPECTIYTTRNITTALDIPAFAFAKVVIFKAGNQFVMAVLPGDHAVKHSKLLRLIRSTGRYRFVKGLTRASERELHGLFPRYEVGAMPPFGNSSRKLDLFIDWRITQPDTIYFKSGKHTQIVAVNAATWLDLAEPTIRNGNFAVPIRYEKPSVGKRIGDWFRGLVS